MSSSFFKRLLAMLAFVAGGVAAEGLRPVICTLLHVTSFSSRAAVPQCGAASHKV